MDYLDKNKPLYLQLVDKLKEKIDLEFDANEKLPSERKICEIYKMSRTTVRLALKELENAGYIYSIQGKGTFVSQLNKNKQNLGDYYSFTEQTKSLGKVPESIVLEFEIIEANEYTAERMELKQGDKVIRFLRLRLADNIPMMLETSFIPCYKFKHFKKEDLMKKPLYDLFQYEYNSKIISVEETFWAGIISGRKSKLLGVFSGDPCLRIERISRDKTNKVIEFTKSIARGDQFNYKILHNYQK